MSEDHVCYMKTTEEEEATRMLKRKRKKTKENERKGSTRTMMCKNGSSLTLNAHKTR